VAAHSQAIEVADLHHRFSNGSQALAGIDLTVSAGEFVVLAGANGAGKTTLLLHLKGLLKPTAGTVRINGVSVAEHARQVRLQVGLVFQDADSQIVGETVYDDVAFGPENLRMPPEQIHQRVSEVLSTVGLSDVARRRPHLLSGGQKRRLAIAGVLAMAPHTILFDEPFTHLDYHGVQQVLAQMVQLHAAGHTIVVATHDLEKVVAHAGRLLVMAKGRVVLDGQPSAIMAQVEQFAVRRPCDNRHGQCVASWLSQ
jgi:biotin transport system ATP-binding protein